MSEMTAVVIAGGQSRRMNSEKAFLRIGKKQLIERVLDALAPVFDEILINANTPEAYRVWGVPVVPDIFPGKGAMGGIYTGLTHARSDFVFCVACDMPFLNPALIRFMLQHIDGADAVIPKTSDGLHPLHAVYSKRCRPVMEELFRQESLKISTMFPLIRMHYLPEEQIRQFDPDLDAFVNINTPEDLEAARQRLAVSTI